MGSDCISSCSLLIFLLFNYSGDLSDWLSHQNVQLKQKNIRGGYIWLNMRSKKAKVQQKSATQLGSRFIAI